MFTIKNNNKKQESKQEQKLKQVTAVGFTLSNYISIE